MPDDMYKRIEKAKQGDALEREKIVEENIGLVWSIAKRYYNRGTIRRIYFKLEA